MAIELLDGVVTPVNAGRYNVTHRLTTGTNAIDKSVGALSAVEIPDSSVSANTEYNLDLPSCMLTADITGNGTISLVLIGG